MANMFDCVDDTTIICQQFSWDGTKAQVYSPNCHQALVKDLQPNEVFPHLIQKRVLTLDDQEGNRKLATRREKIEEFLTILPTRGPCAYEEFVKALENSQAFLACLLLKEGTGLFSSSRFYFFNSAFFPRFNCSVNRVEERVSTDGVICVRPKMADFNHAGVPLVVQMILQDIILKDKLGLSLLLN